MLSLVPDLPGSGLALAMLTASGPDLPGSPSTSNAHLSPWPPW